MQDIAVAIKRTPVKILQNVDRIKIKQTIPETKNNTEQAITENEAELLKNYRFLSDRNKSVPVSSLL